MIRVSAVQRGQSALAQVAKNLTGTKAGFGVRLSGQRQRNGAKGIGIAAEFQGEASFIEARGTAW